MATATEPPNISPSPVEPQGLYEVLNGRVVVKPLMGAFEVNVATRLVVALATFVESRRLGWVQSEMLFLLDRANDLQRRPDVAFVSSDRWPLHHEVPRTSAWDVVPDLAIEVISPSNMATNVLEKLGEYFQAGTRLVWVVFPTFGQVYVYKSIKDLAVLDASQDLDGDVVLPGFRLPLATILGAGNTSKPEAAVPAPERSR